MANLSITVANGLSATIDRYPSGNLLPGQACLMRARDITGFTGSDEYEELDVVWSGDDTGATYAVGGGGQDNDANAGHGRSWAKAWTTAGTKTPTASLRVLDNDVPAAVEETVTVEDPDTVTWDNDWYFSTASDFTGAPAEDIPAGIRHISTVSALQALSASAGESTRLSFRKGETITWNNVSWQFGGGRFYVTTFGAGANPVIEAGDSANANPSSLSTIRYVFRWPNDPSGMEFICYGIDFDGKYDPKTGAAPQGLMTPFYGIDGETDDYSVSIFQCGFTGCWETLTSANLDRGTVGNINVVDCSISDWSNYGLAFFGGRQRLGVTGNSIKQNPLALNRAGEGKLDSFPQSPDHGPVRAVSALLAAFENNTFATSSGWVDATGVERAVQPCIRALPTFAVGEAPSDIVEYSFHKNKSIGAHFGQIGTANDFEELEFPRFRAVFEGNDHTPSRHNLHGLFVTELPGIYARNNVVYHPDISVPYGTGVKTCEFTDPPGVITVSSEAATARSVVAFNTSVSDRTAPSADYDHIDTSGWTATSPTATANVVWADGHQNTGTFTDYTPLDRANDFRPVTASAAIDAITSGTIPVRDFSGNLRGSTTNAGAHDVESVSAGTVSAPVNSVAPVIAELANFADEYALTSAGTWTNLTDDDLYLMEWEWNVDATPIVDPKRVVYDAAGVSGDVANDLVVTNRSGNRVTQRSNTITRA